MHLVRRTLEQLFISKVRIKALKYFVMNPDAPIHLRAAGREFDEEVNAVRRELERLEEVELIQSEKSGNRKYFKTNKTHPYFESFFPLIHKAYGLGGEMVEGAKTLGKIDFALLTDGFTKGVRQGIYSVDLLVVGDVDIQKVDELVKKWEQKLQREIHYSILKPSEFLIRKKRKDSFVLEIIVQPKVMLIGTNEDLISGIA